MEQDEEGLRDDVPTELSRRKGAVEPTSGDAGAMRYRLGKRLGAGGMAVVYQAEDTQLARSVAVKVLRQELVRNPEARSRFVTEARVIAELDHPGVVPVFEIGRLPEGADYYAMKEVRGQTLKEVLALRPPHDLGDRHGLVHYVDLFARVCETMAAAHDHGIVHRDLKPANVMVDEHGAVCVMDWGLAKRLTTTGDDLSGETHAGAVMGTPAYMSPEQASGRADDANRQSDVFSLGVMLYEILTRNRPFAGDTPRDTMDTVVLTNPPPPRKVDRRVPRALSAVCMKALSKRPADRYASAGELAADLRRYREFRPVSVAPPTLGERLVYWIRRHPTAAAVLATVVLTVLVVGGAASLQAATEFRMVTGAYERIDAAEIEIDDIEAKIDRIITELTDGQRVDRAAAEQMLVDLRARREGLHETVVSLATAIAGFTVFEPEERALRILREALFERVEHFMESGQLARAEVTLNGALRVAKERNPLNLADDEIRQLDRWLTTVKSR